MNKFFLGMAQTICTAALIANIAFLFQVNARLTRIETQLGIETINHPERITKK